MLTEVWRTINNNCLFPLFSATKVQNIKCSGQGTVKCLNNEVMASFFLFPLHFYTMEYVIPWKCYTYLFSGCIFKKIYYVYIWSACIHVMYTYGLPVHMPADQKRAPGHIDVYVLSCDSWELNLGPLDEYPVLALNLWKKSIQTGYNFFFFKKKIPQNQLKVHIPFFFFFKSSLLQDWGLSCLKIIEINMVESETGGLSLILSSIQ